MLDAVISVRALNPEWEFALITPAEGDLVDEARGCGVPTTVRPFPSALAGLGEAGDGPASGSRLRTLGRLGVSAPGVALYARALAQEVTRLNPDVIHANGFKMHILGAHAKTPDAALLWHLHDYVRARPMMPSILKMHLGRTAAIVANSNDVAADARMAFGPSVPIRTVRNGIDLERFSPRGAVADLDALARMPNPGPGVVRVGLVATGARWKGHELFLRALAMISDDVPLRAYVIGGPIYQTVGSQFTLDELRALAIQLGVAHRVGFTGYLREVAAAMRALDVVVHCSVAPEPFGLVIAEALASGCALITSAQGGSAELITPERDALIYDRNDAASLARTLERLIADRGLRAALGGAGRLTAEARFSRERMGRELSAIYRDVAGSGELDGDAVAARS